MKQAWGLVSLLIFLTTSLSTPTAQAAGTGTVVAVFDIEDTREGKAKLAPKKLRSLTDYLVNKLGVGGKFEIAPRANVRAALQAKKKESYNTCFDEACQIEIGKEIAAQKSLATKIDQMGGECIVTATLYDLRKGATENSASYRGPCGHSELLTAIEQIAFKLRGEKPSQASKKGIRFDTTALPEVPTLDMPSDADGASSGVDFGNVDVDSMELLDSAIQADKDKNLPIKDKIARWENVKKRSPKYTKQATAKIVAWKQYQRKKLQIEQIQKKRAAKMMQDWKKLSRLLKLKMVSDEDKRAWAEAFFEAYREEAKTNPFVRDSAARRFINAEDEKKRLAEEAERKVEEAERKVEEAKRKAEKDKRDAEVRRQLAKKVRANLPWLHSAPAGIDFLKTEVTVAQYRACVDAGKCSPPMRFDTNYCNWRHSDRDTHPINCVDWNQSTQFCEWAGGRLPTVDEWYAEASNKGSRKYPWGDEVVSCERAVWSQGGRGCGRDSTWPVCSKPAGNSVSGLCDMSGNLMEWTSSSFRNVSTGETNVRMSGASWDYKDPDYMTASYGISDVPNYRDARLGLRCARSAAK